MDTLDVLDVGTEVRRVINLVLEEDTRDLVADEVGWLVDVVAGVQVVVLQRAGRDGELKVTTGFEVGVTNGATPHLECVGGHGIFGRRFLVTAIPGLVQTVSP